MASDVRPLERSMEDGEATSTDGSADYDVFISHRGPDTKTGFVSFLQKDLVASGLRSFLDCESIDVGEECWERVEHAIKKTPISMVIFSENFAESQWCLRELHVMLDTPGVKVLPIFYNVRPSEVRFLESGKLKGGLEKLMMRHDKRVIDEWRADLDFASRLRGWEHSDGDRRLQRDLVTEVVRKVTELANRPLLLDVGDYVVGVTRAANEIVQILDARDDEKKVLILGLWGMGGIGKSTLAKELYNRLCKMEFDSTCYVEDVSEKENEGGVVRVQNCILKDLCRDGSIEISNKSSGKTILERRLCERRILLVLDDVGDKHEMEYWISRRMLSRGSMCIVTSRDRRVLKSLMSFDMDREIYIHAVQALSGGDSKQVFASYALGGIGKVKPRFEELVTNVSEACGGVPLVLKVCGARLKGEEDVGVWEDVMKKLKCGSIMDTKKIFDCLRMSYDVLAREEQVMFLDIACALLGESKDVAMRLWNSSECGAKLGVQSLVDKALITVDWFGKLRMHDHLRDMGRRIVIEERQRDGVCRRVWMPESLSLLEGDEALPDSLESMVVYKNGKDEFDKVAADTLNVAQMKKLRILICKEIMNVASKIPSSLGWFALHRQGLKGDSNNIIIPRHNNLIIMDLTGSTLHIMPQSFENLSKLEILNFTTCQKLKMLLVSFGNLRSLEELYLGGFAQVFW